MRRKPPISRFQISNFKFQISILQGGRSGETPSPSPSAGEGGVMREPLDVGNLQFAFCILVFFWHPSPSDLLAPQA